MLRKKALRAFFSIRRIVDTIALTTTTMIKLIDIQVKPVAMYAFETTHIKMRKWTLGMHKK